MNTDSGLKICGCDCYLSAEWKSKNKIVARSGPGKGRGDIIVTTRAGGDGTSTVQFRGYHEAVGPMKESAVWVDEASPAAPWGRRPLSPATFTPPDPLGLAAEGDDYKLPEEELHELFPEGSGNLADENFEPGWYLLEHHSNTSFPDLMAGAAFLQRKVEGQKEGQLSFLKDNAGEVIDRLDRLLHIKLACDHDRDHDRLRLDQLQTAIRESIELSNSLFSEMLSRKQRVERTRAALTLLSRHKFLFQLPAAIDANVRKHDYEVVVNDYARVRNLFGGSRVKVFQKILSVIDKKMDDLKRTLHAKIVQMPISIQEQRKLIRLLNSLGWEGDAAWDAILSRKAHLDDVMNKVKEHFQQQEEKSKEGGCWSAGRAEWCAAACAALTEETRALWTLGRWYFGGELGGAAEAEGGESRRRFKELVVRSVEGFATHMRACVLGEGSAPPPLVRARLAAGLRHLRLARDALRRLDLPSQPLGIVEEVIAAYRAHGADTFLRAARAHVCALRARETWALHDYSPHGAITKLPELLQGYVEDALASIAESAVGAAPAAPASVVNDGLQRQLGDILHEFTAVLRDLVRDEELSNSDLSVALEQAPEEELTPPPAWRRRLLLTSSNAHRTRTHVLPQLEAAALRLSLAVPRAALEESAASLRALEEELVCVYLEHVGDPLVGTIEPSMYLCRVTPSAITDARPYVYEIINNVLVVHAEVDSVCSGVAGRCVREVCETVCEELARLAHASPPSCPNAALANTVDLTLLALAMHAHLSPTARNHLNEALSACACDPLQAEEHARKKENIVSLFKKRMELQLASLEHSAALV